MSWSVLSLCARGPFCSVSMMIHQCMAYARNVCAFFIDMHTRIPACTHICVRCTHTYIRTYIQTTDRQTYISRRYFWQTGAVRGFVATD